MTRHCCTRNGQALVVLHLYTHVHLHTHFAFTHPHVHLLRWRTQADRLEASGSKRQQTASSSRRTHVHEPQGAGRAHAGHTQGTRPLLQPPTCEFPFLPRGLTTVEADPCFQACVNGFAEDQHPRSIRAGLSIVPNISLPSLKGRVCSLYRALSHRTLTL